MLTRIAGQRCCEHEGCGESATVRLRLRLPHWNAGESIDLCPAHGQALLERALVVEDVDHAGWVAGSERARTEQPLVSHVEDLTLQTPTEVPAVPERVTQMDELTTWLARHPGVQGARVRDAFPDVEVSTYLTRLQRRGLARQDAQGRWTLMEAQ